VKPYVIDKLINLNQRFYQTFADQFSSTRGQLQPGVKRISQDLAPDINILDLGCGNGEFILSIMKNHHKGIYVGIDSSLELLKIAASKVHQGDQSTHQKYKDLISSKDKMVTITFEKLKIFLINADITNENWSRSFPQKSFDLIVAFAVLHHIPGNRIRKQILSNVSKMLAPHGQFILSVWQFLNSSRLKKRIQPWEKIELSKSDVDSGDYILDWRHGGYALRYVHQFDPRELEILANKCGFYVKRTFFSDGEGGNLGLYQIWEPILDDYT
jgi:SAM-dependent methyltransferase